MKKTTSLLLAAIIAGSAFTTAAMADVKRGQRYYLKKLSVCKKDGFINASVFAVKHNRAGWAKLKEEGKLVDDWKQLCPSGASKIEKMKEKDVTNLYDFCWKFASDGEVPSCG